MMKCFYHEERDAVATCQRCGKSLCKECASKYSPCMCYDCAQQVTVENENKKRLAKELDLIDTKTEFFKAVTLGLIAAFVGFVFQFFVECNGSFTEFFSSISNFMLGFFLFFVPFGWPFSRILPSFSDNMVIEFFLWVGKFCIALICGVPCAIFQLIKFIIRLNNNKKM